MITCFILSLLLPSFSLPFFSPSVVMWLGWPRVSLNYDACIFSCSCTGISHTRLCWHTWPHYFPLVAVLAHMLSSTTRCAASPKHLTLMFRCYRQVYLWTLTVSRGMEGENHFWAWEVIGWNFDSFTYRCFEIYAFFIFQLVTQRLWFYAALLFYFPLFFMFCKTVFSALDICYIYS